jgi:hypothetical protein
MTVAVMAAAYMEISFLKTGLMASNPFLGIWLVLVI